MRDMHDLIELMTTWFDDVQRLDQKTLSQLMKMGSKVQRLLEFTGKVKAVAKGEQGMERRMDALHPGPHAVRGQHHLPHPVPHHHHRAGLGAAVLPLALAGARTTTPG